MDTAATDLQTVGAMQPALVDGLLYGWVAASAIAKGRIASIDETRARAVPGVVEVITHYNRPRLPWLDRSYADEVSVPGSPFRALYDDKVAFSAQPIALVVAETLEAARGAAALIDVVYDAGEHDTGLHVVMRDRLVHHPMEMQASTVIWDGDNGITVYDKARGSQNVQGYLSAIFGFPKDDVRVMNSHVGGASGSGLRPQYQVYLATLAAKMLKRSVRVVLTRQQMFSPMPRPEAIQPRSAATDASGRPQAMVDDATDPTSRFAHYAGVVVDWGRMAWRCRNASGEYAITRLEPHAPGSVTGMTLFERTLDEMAHAAGIDPLQFRLPGDAAGDAMHDKPRTPKALRDAYARGAERFGWRARSAEPRSMRDGRELIGFGMASIGAEETARPSPGGLVGTIQKARDIHGAVFADVRVDEQLGIVRVARIIAAVAAVRIGDPTTARSQVLGGVVMGIGMALHEETRLLTGRGLDEGRTPAYAAIDHIDVLLVDEPDAGVADDLDEIVIAGTAAAVANAIFHATGLRVRDLPVTIDKPS